MTRPVTVNGALATAAFVLGLAALVAGSPYREMSDRVWAPAPDGSVSALVVAQWLRERKTGLRVVDLRGPEEYEQFHLPRAEPLRAFEPGETVVVYGADSLEARLAAQRLRDAGIDTAYYLADGVAAWFTDVLNPTLSPDASPGERAAWERVAELSRYFGGLPRIVSRGAAQRSTAEVMRRTMRRGCAF